MTIATAVRHPLQPVHKHAPFVAMHQTVPNVLSHTAPEQTLQLACTVSADMVCKHVAACDMPLAALSTVCSAFGSDAHCQQAAAPRSTQGRSIRKMKDQCSSHPQRHPVPVTSPAQRLTLLWNPSDLGLEHYSILMLLA
jgi:hypothetical protein